MRGIAGGGTFADNTGCNLDKLAHGIPGDMKQVGEGPVHHIQKAEDNGKLDKHGQTPGGHGVVFPLVKGLYLLVHLLGVIFVLLLDLLHFRLDDLHFDGGLLLLDGKGDKQRLGDDGKEDDGPPVVMDDLVNRPHNVTKRVAEDFHDKLK